MRKIWAVAVKELKQIGRDPLSLIILIGLPAFLLVLFGYAISFDVENVPLAVQDRDPSPASRRLVQAFVSSGRFDLVASPAAGADLERLTERREAQAILVIPEDFSAELAAGRAAEVQLLLDGTDSTTATTVLGYANGIVSSVSASLAVEQLRAAGLDSALRAGIDYQPRVWYNPQLESSHFLVPGLIAFIMMLTAVLSTAMCGVRDVIVAWMRCW